MKNLILIFAICFAACKKDKAPEPVYSNKVHLVVNATNVYYSIWSIGLPGGSQTYEYSYMGKFDLDTTMTLQKGATIGVIVYHKNDNSEVKDNQNHIEIYQGTELLHHYDRNSKGTLNSKYDVK